jgi:hypothetical protein
MKDVESPIFSLAFLYITSETEMEFNISVDFVICKLYI